MAGGSWECKKLFKGYVITQSGVPGCGVNQEAVLGPVEAVQNLIEWLGLRKYQLVREEDE